ALQEFGDRGRSQPPREQRTCWYTFGYTREWGRLSPLHPAPNGLDSWELVNGPIAEGFEASPRSEPEGIEESVYNDVLLRLATHESMRSIERATKLSIRQVAKIESYQKHPNRLGPNGAPGYALYRRPSRPGTVFLRSLRHVRP